MHDLDKALSEIVEIRSQIAAGTAFRGYGPLAVGLTGVAGFLTALVQAVWLPAPDANPTAFVSLWLVAAVFSAVLVNIEMQGRSRRFHSSLADTMIHQAMEQFTPAAAASIALPLLLLRIAPGSLWMLPGLWQLFVCLGLFASLRTLPRGIALVGGWYFLTAFACLMLASRDHLLSPWLMGVPFLIGQSLMAAVLYFSAGENDDES
jgi:hypothetical protein